MSTTKKKTDSPFRGLGGNKKALIPYITLGDPNKSTTEKLIKTAFDAGADIVELGIPFSDPIADGPVIQASHQRALEKYPDISIQDGLTLVQKVKKTHAKPIVFMLASQLVLTFGVQAFFKAAQAHGLDGVIIPDLPLEEADEYLAESKRTGVHLILLVSPLCDETRLKKIVKATSGFLYLISSTGTTGQRESLGGNLKGLCQTIKKIRDIPIYVGFGISTPAHVKAVHQFADGAIVGSHFVQCIHESKDPVKRFQQNISDFC